MPADAPHAEFNRRLLPRLKPLLESPPDPGDEQLEATALLEDALRARATDIHLDPHQESLRIRLRITGGSCAMPTSLSCGVAWSNVARR